MLYFYNDGNELIQLIVDKTDNDGNIIYKRLDSDQVFITAIQYVSDVYEEMTLTGEDIGLCVERVNENYRQLHKGKTLTYEPANDDVIKEHMLNDYEAYREENGNPILTIEDIRKCL
jgi:hypothetical protein